MAVRLHAHVSHTLNYKFDVVAVAGHAVVKNHEIDWTTAKVIECVRVCGQYLVAEG